MGKKLELSECRGEADFGLFFVLFRSFMCVKMCTFVTENCIILAPLCTLGALTFNHSVELLNLNPEILYLITMFFFRELLLSDDGV